MEDFIPIFAIFAVFGTITAIIVGPTYFKARERRDIQKTVRAAIDKGQPMPPEVIEADTIARKPAPQAGVAVTEGLGIIMGGDDRHFLPPLPDDWRISVVLTSPYQTTLA